MTEEPPPEIEENIFARQHATAAGIVRRCIPKTVLNLPSDKQQELFKEAAHVQGDLVRVIIGESAVGTQEIHAGFARWLTEHGIVEGEKAAAVISEQICDRLKEHFSPALRS